MNRKIKALCAGCLSLMLLLSGCGGKGTGDQNASAVKPVEDYVSHKVNATLHQVSVTESPRPFVVNGASDYKLIVAEGAANETAADYTQRYVERVTGCRLEYAEASQFDTGGKFIVFNDADLFKKAGLTMPAVDLDSTGYYIKTSGDNVFLMTQQDFGARYAVIAFLKHVLGMQVYGQDTFVYTKDGTTLPDMEITEKPDIGNILLGNWRDTFSADALYLMGYSDYKTQFLSIQNQDNHTSLLYLPVETYYQEHPAWFSAQKDQLCYTAGGDAEELDAMTSEAARVMLENIMANPNIHAGQFTMADTWTSCQCQACNDSAKQYGTRSAAVIQFTNMLSRKIQSGLQKYADENGTEKRDFTLYLMAYHKFVEPPVVKNSDGTYTPNDPSLVCDEDVGVIYAPIEAKYIHNFYEQENVESAEMMKAWSTLSSKMYYWLYQTNYAGYLYPFDSWDSDVENLRFCYENKVDIVMIQGQHNMACSTGFTSLKVYTDSLAAMDLSLSYQDMVNDFFQNYYGAAAAPMQQYFEELQSWMRYLEQAYPVEYTGDIYNLLVGENYWPREMLLHWQDLIDQAYEALNEGKNTDPNYEIYMNHVKMESIFLRYELITSHSGIYSAEQILQMKQSFKADCIALGITHEYEQRELTEVYRDWGIS